MEKETLEEAAENYSKITLNKSGLMSDKQVNGFIAGYKLAQERMYSEEDMKQFAWECVANFLSNRNNKVEMALVEVIMDRNSKQFEQFEQFKKK